jgi:toxin ParE1/3/4
MGHRLAPQAAADLEDIAYYLFLDSGSLDVADRLSESITGRFAMLATHPRAGRRRDDLRPGLRGFPAGAYIVLYRVEDGDVVIVRVLRGSRDLEGIFRE